MAKSPANKKKGRKPKLVPELVAAELVKLNGNVAAVARKFGVDRSSVRDLIESREALRKIALDCREAMKDAVENQFYSDCLKDEAVYQTSRIFYLKTQGKDRGYIERQEHTGKDGGPMEQIHHKGIDWDQLATAARSPDPVEVEILAIESNPPTPPDNGAEYDPPRPYPRPDPGRRGRARQRRRCHVPVGRAAGLGQRPGRVCAEAGAGGVVERGD